MIDELNLTQDDLKMMKRGETPATVEILKRLKNRLKMCWVVTSTLSLLDNNSNVSGVGGLIAARVKEIIGYNSDVELGQQKLDTVMSGAGYKTVLLPNIMRCSRQIAEATSPGSYNSYHKMRDVTISIAEGSASTVAGTRPTAILYKRTLLGDAYSHFISDISDYEVLAGCVSLYLEREKINTATSSVAILCDGEISATKLAAKLQLPGLYTYTAGVERFYYNSAKYSSKGGSGDTSSVEAWLERGGVLLTHSKQFRGCEADVVIVVNRYFAGYDYDGRRSGLTRGVASLCLITDDNVKVDEMRKVYNVIYCNQ